MRKSPASRSTSHRDATSLPEQPLEIEDQAPTFLAPSDEEVAHRAYANHENQGAVHGQDVEDWLAAEAELIAERQHEVINPDPGSSPEDAEITQPLLTTPEALPLLPPEWRDL